MNIVTVRKDSYHVSAVPVGTVIDPRQFTPERQIEIDRLRSLPLAGLGSLELGAQGQGAGHLRFRVENPTARPIETTFTPEYEGHNWLFAPDHLHARLEPGASREFDLSWARRAVGFDTSYSKFSEPKLHVAIGYLEESARIAVPPRTLTLSVKLRDLPPEAFEPTENLALHVGGGGDALRVDSSAFDLPDGPFTIECDLFPHREKASDVPLAKTENSEFGIMLDGGRVDFLVWLGGKYVHAKSAAPLIPRRWQHVAGVFDGKELRVYVDGQLVATQAGKGTRKRNNHPLYIGADPNNRGRPNRGFDGLLDNVRLSRGVRYSGERFEPRATHDLDDETVLLFSLDRALGPFVPSVPGGPVGARTGNAKIGPRGE